MFIMGSVGTTYKPGIMKRKTVVCKSPWIEPDLLIDRLGDRPGLLWIDSGMDHERTGRWSYIMWEPFGTISGSGDRFVFSSGHSVRRFGDDPFDLLDSVLARWSAEPNDGFPHFTGGVAGFWGYDLLIYCEPSTRFCKTGTAEEGDLWLGLYDRLIAFDHVKSEMSLIASVEEGRDGGGELDSLRRDLEQIMSAKAPMRKIVPPRTDNDVLPVSDFSKESFMAAVERVRRYIEEGDCYQVNIAQRFTVPETVDPVSIYMRLRSVSPAPFAAYLNTGQARIMSSSPERFLEMTGSHVQTRPIKGTRPRGAALYDDQLLRADLIQSDKDRAENVMIVDLLRNDLSKVCMPNSVKAPELCALEEFPTVFHLVSTVEGEIAPEYGPVDLLKTAFPGGSVTGAPKIRAMEIIDELEPAPRGAYCGAMGYIGFDGAMDTNIVIRTIVHAGGLYKFHVGGGITWLSDAEDEFNETMDKARAMMEAVRG